MSSHARTLLTPGASRKRKEMESFDGATSQKPLTGSTTATTSSKAAVPQLQSSNRLLAGYMAYEFLSKGTLLGQKFDPVDTKNKKVENRKFEPATYTEVANLLRMGGAHVPGVVNPTQLARWMHDV